MYHRWKIFLLVIQKPQMVTTVVAESSVAGGQDAGDKTDHEDDYLYHYYEYDGDDVGTGAGNGGVCATRAAEATRV